MSLEPGTKLGAYEILEGIGAGGMGEVYKARDTKLGREVAIKVLPETLAHDAERLARLEREAKLLASVNHPAIATLHGLEDIHGTRCLVMELVEGEDLAYLAAEGPGHDFDIWTLERGEAGSAQPFLDTPFHEDHPEFSPDGRFIAYVSDESGRSEVFVRTFPDSGAKWSVSSGEGTEPRWAPDGKSLYYRAPTEMMIVDVETEPTFSVSRPRALFADRFERLPGRPGFRNFDLSPDGERFLVLEPHERDEYDTIHVVLDWFEELERLVPTR